jgi:hypothetical protein
VVIHNLFVLPWGIASLIETIAGIPGGLGLIAVLTAIESGLILFKVYPRAIHLLDWELANAALFYLALNVISNTVVVIWVIANVGAGR